MVAPPVHHERAFGVTNIKNHIPLIFYLDDHNYDAWRELFHTHCLAFDVSGHIDGTALPTGDDDAAWFKRDGLVKLWLYGALQPKLFRNSFKTGGTARDIWIRVENQFRNNKEARAIQLDNELRTTEIGDMTIQAYCQKLRSLSDLLTNVDAPVTDITLVMYLLNGLNGKFDNIINVIKHREPFPSFESAKSMLEMEEKRIYKIVKPSASSSSTSSTPTALTVADDKPVSTPTKSQTHGYNNNNYRGRRKNNKGRGRGNNNRFNNQNNWSPYGYWPVQYSQWPQQYPFWGPPPQQNQVQRGLLGPRPSTSQQGNFTMANPQLTTDFAHAFNTMTLADPSSGDWYMDSGATSHMAANEGILKSSLNNRINQCVIVGNGSRIPVVSTGNTNLTSPTRSLSLNKVLITPQIVKKLISVRKFTRDNLCSVEFDPFGFSVKDLLTRTVLLCSNSSGDLYSIPADLTSSSTSPLFFFLFLQTYGIRDLLISIKTRFFL